jgi:hypothetical protein
MRFTGRNGLEQTGYNLVIEIPLFHNWRKKNSIKKLKDDDGDWVEGTTALKPLIMNYFN